MLKCLLAMLRHVAIVGLLLACPGVKHIDWQSLASADDVALTRAFANPADAHKPWAYWWWLNANVTEQSITRDLEQMRAKGFGGFLLFDVTAYGHDLVPPPPRKIAFMSPAWRSLLRHAMQEADRLGLQMSVNLSTCGGALQAPWPLGEHAAKQLVWKVVVVDGPGQVAGRLAPAARPHFRDVSLVAARVIEGKPDVDALQPAEGHATPIDWPEAWSTTMRDTFNQRGRHVGSQIFQPDKPLTVDRAIDLSPHVDSERGFTWNVPAGRWVLIRFGCEPIPERGNDVDILNTEAVDHHFQRMGKVILDDAGPLAGKTLTHFYNVSWEGTSPSWTPGFAQQFHRFRAYKIVPLMPALAGMTVENAETTGRFHRDYSRTLSDCFLHNCYARFTELCHAAGVQWHSESGGPWRDFPLFEYADQLEFWGANDMPQGEFWWPSTSHTNARRTANAAHIYEKPLASIEAFTHMRMHWSAYPAALKPYADYAFCDGVNLFVWHTSSASPASFGKPGIVYFAGTHINRNVTWWEMAGPMLSYLSRCQTMLQQGRYVADVCCYTGDRNRTNWGRLKQWSSNPSVQLPEGFSFDIVNTDVLLNRLSFEDGRLQLPGGMGYRLMVVDLDEDAVPPAALEKIQELASAGATVVLGHRRPQRAPGLRDYPNADEDVQRLASEIWGPPAEKPSLRVLRPEASESAATLADVLRVGHVLPDCVTPWQWTHRRTGQTDIYFLAGTGRAECTFRIAGRRPELWDPVSGTIRDAVCWRATEDGRTVVPITLPDDGSLFVVFRRPAARGEPAVIAAPDEAVQIVGRNDDNLELAVWRSGEHQLKAATGRSFKVGPMSLPEPKELGGPWLVRFAPGWRAPESTEFPRLTPWNEHPDPNIKHYSGTASYEKQFELSPQQADNLVRLQLGDVKHVARVSVNGTVLGIVWTAPWSVDLTGAVRPGKNHLRVDVANTWANRLIGDAGLPESERLTRTNVRYEKGKRTLAPFQSFSSEDKLMPSGLLGPVRLEFGRAVNQTLAP